MDSAPDHIKAKGQLRHRFWGRYSARVALRFDNEADAVQGSEILRTSMPADMKPVINACGQPWKPGVFWHKSAPTWCVLEFDQDDVNAVLDVLEKFGADRKKIDSVATSIDFGERFEISLPKPAQTDTPDPCPSSD